MTKEGEEIEIAGVKIITNPEVFNPAVFFSSEWFAGEISGLTKGESILIEVGCGTGIVSIKSAIENPDLKVYATDINDQAAVQTKINAELNKVSDRIFTYSGDVLDSIPKDIKANSIFWAMPFGYLNPTDELEGRDTQVFDPGYRAIRKFFSDSKKYLKKGGRILIGFSKDIGHMELLEEIARENNTSLKLLVNIEGVEKTSVSMEIFEAKYIG